MKEFAKQVMYGVAMFIDELAGYFVAGAALTLGYYAGVDVHNWLINFS